MTSNLSAVKIHSDNTKITLQIVDVDSRGGVWSQMQRTFDRVQFEAAMQKATVEIPWQGLL